MKTRKLAVVEAPVVVKRTRDEVSASSMTSIVFLAQQKISRAKHSLKDFSEKLAKDAANAFEWSQSVFKAAADKKVAEQVLAYVEQVRANCGDEYGPASDLKVIQVLREEFYREVLRRASFPERSTSPQSNEMSRDVCAARAEWLERLDNTLERISEAQ